MPNLFPAVRREGGSAYGVHEVVIESPRHEASLAAFSAGQIRDVFRVYRDRLAVLRADPRLAYVQVFKNHGAAAGASIEHAHSQILAGTEMPREIRAEMTGSNEYLARNGRCTFCDLIDRELAAGERVILASEHVVAVAAWAGRFPYETWILPRRHAAHFDRISDVELTDLAAAMGTVIRAGFGRRPATRRTTSCCTPRRRLSHRIIIGIGKSCRGPPELRAMSWRLAVI